MLVPRFLRAGVIRAFPSAASMANIERARLANDFKDILLDLEKHEYPNVQNPLGCKKRASVACIVRFRPSSQAPPKLNEGTTRGTVRDRINSFFENDWAANGDPEILFIRRAARQGDRWTSQVALPGGKRDPEDASDLATSIRETAEEVGLDLDSDKVIHVGNLPQRIITTEWGAVPLMVLCPYVFLVTDPALPPLRLQPTEIASAHWVPARALMTESLWTYETANTSDRYAKRGGALLKYSMRALLGQMLFGATRLVPSESVYSTSVPGFIPPSRTSTMSQIGSEVPSLLFGHYPVPGGPDKPLLLWGLTHGIVVDLLRLLPESNILSSWRWPTFSAPDVRLAIWLISWRFRRDKMRGTKENIHGPYMVIEEGFASKDNAASTGTEESSASFPQHSAVHYMLHGYFDMTQRGIWLALLVRFGAGLAVGLYAGREFMKRK